MAAGPVRKQAVCRSLQLLQRQMLFQKAEGRKGFVLVKVQLFAAGLPVSAGRKSGKVGYGFDAYNEVYVDMMEAGIVDPTKVTRSALQNAASIAATVLTTEAVVANQPEPEPAAPAAGGMGGMY